MIYHIIYSSAATTPMQSDDLKELLVHAETKNAAQGISGALVYTDGIFLQILEGEATTVKALMAKIRRDVRHDTVAILREGEIPAARFGQWSMAYLSATPAQVARWAGIRNTNGMADTVDDADEDASRTARFAQDILALLESGQSTPLVQ